MNDDDKKQKMVENYFQQMMDGTHDFGDAEDEHEEGAGAIPIEVLEEIRDKKSKGMFVSGWENDDTDIIPKNMTDPVEQFLTAAEEGDLQTIKEKLQKDGSLKFAKDQDGYTAMHRAAYNKHIDVVKYLLQAGANPEAQTNEGWTVLHSAAYWGNFDAVGILISFGMDVNVTSNGNLTPLHCALNSEADVDEQYTTIRYLLEAPGVDVGIVSSGGESALQIGLKQRECIRNLFQKFRMSFIYMKEWIFKNGYFILHYIGIILASIFILSITFVNLRFTCFYVYGDDYCHSQDYIAAFLLFEILFNLFLFQRTLKNNHVTYWTLKSSSFFTDDIASAYTNAPPVPSYVTKAQLDDRQKEILEKIDKNGVYMGEDDHYYYEAHGLKSQSPTKYCMACRCVAPRRAHHCPICDICILRKDHHCFFTGGCIGLANQRYFMIFCLWGGIGAMYGLRFTIAYMNKFVAPAFPYGFVYWLSPVALVRWLIGYETFSNVFLGTFFTITLSVVFGALGFFGAQCFYTYHGFTMYDYHEGRLRDHIESDGETLLERIKLIFGKHWYLNIIFPLFWERNEITPKTARNIFLSVAKDL
ncbi:Lethal (2) 35Be [Strongyloides ratti]|uniref:Palmitoyltransferase n=1 Tax=Strongyloides ratti TaxID=34506 RepID=A0A090L3K3_STRRB|nr:Lethal (2) 35Be [Strongyloides ratti]CEF62677.1 Lethal (2) 35Be [Strongyloides ratti]